MSQGGFGGCVGVFEGGGGGGGGGGGAPSLTVRWVGRLVCEQGLVSTQPPHGLYSLLELDTKWYDAAANLTHRIELLLKLPEPVTIVAQVLSRRL